MAILKARPSLQLKAFETPLTSSGLFTKSIKEFPTGLLLNQILLVFTFSIVRVAGAGAATHYLDDILNRLGASFSWVGQNIGQPWVQTGSTLYDTAQVQKNRGYLTRSIGPLDNLSANAGALPFDSTVGAGTYNYRLEIPISWNDRRRARPQDLQPLTDYFNNSSFQLQQGSFALDAVTTITDVNLTCQVWGDQLPSGSASLLPCPPLLSQVIYDTDQKDQTLPSGQGFFWFSVFAKFPQTYNPITTAPPAVTGVPTSATVYIGNDDFVRQIAPRDLNMRYFSEVLFAQQLEEATVDLVSGGTWIDVVREPYFPLVYMSDEATVADVITSANAPRIRFEGTGAGFQAANVRYLVETINPTDFALAQAYARLIDPAALPKDLYYVGVNGERVNYNPENGLADGLKGVMMTVTGSQYNATPNIV